MTSSAWRLQLYNPRSEAVWAFAERPHLRCASPAPTEKEIVMTRGASEPRSRILSCHAAAPLRLVRPSLVSVARARAAASRGSPSSLCPDKYRSLPQIIICSALCRRVNARASGARSMLTTGLACVPPHFYAASRCSSGKSRCASRRRAHNICAAARRPACIHEDVITAAVQDCPGDFVEVSHYNAVRLWFEI